jgi:hypothetical protein
MTDENIPKAEPQGKLPTLTAIGPFCQVERRNDGIVIGDRLNGMDHPARLTNQAQIEALIDWLRPQLSRIAIGDGPALSRDEGKLLALQLVDHFGLDTLDTWLRNIREGLK